MNDIKLSICIAVYNQSDLVKECIKSILSYKGDDIEIIIGDDCSTENIREIADSYKDKRIRFHCNEHNLGHDLNILSMLKECRANYAFVLRSRDKLFGYCIPQIIECIGEHTNGSVFLFSAKDENGNNVLEFSDVEYEKGKESAKAHTKLFIHPSGIVFRVDGINFELIEKYLKKYFNNHYGFVVHELVRMELVDEGSFITSSQTVWQYTQKKTDVAVNSSRDHKSVYAPEYQYPRYCCEFEFAIKELGENGKRIIPSYLVKRFYKSIAFDFLYENANLESQKHYDFSPITFSKKEERARFREYSENMFNQFLDLYQTKKFIRLIDYETILHLAWYPIKHKMVAFCLARKNASEIVKKYKMI